MNATLSFAEQLLTQAQNHLRFGQRNAARGLLSRLLSFGEVERPTREAAHHLLAELHLDAQRFSLARRHRVAALALYPESAESYYLLARTLEADPNGCPERATRLIRRAVARNSSQPRYWAAYATLALRTGRRKTALRALRRAVELQPRELGVLQEVVEGFIALDRYGSAGRFLREQRFAFAGSAGFEKLFHRFRFEALRAQQGRRGADAASPSILSLTSAMPASGGDPRGPGSGQILRHDRFSRRHSHLARLLAMRPGPRNAS